MSKPSRPPSPSVPPTPLDRQRLGGPAPEAAVALLGAILVHHTEQGPLGGEIVEVEAYDQDDAASHSARGMTTRTEPMFGPAGHAYVYRSYGIHLCMNVSCGPVGRGAAVLIRALRPVLGLQAMAQRRGIEAAWRVATLAQRIRLPLCRGPGNLTQAIGLSLSQSGVDLLGPGPLQLLQGARAPDLRVAAGPRIGISRAQAVPWRFWLAPSPYVSGPATANRLA